MGLSDQCTPRRRRAKTRRRASTCNLLPCLVLLAALGALLALCSTKQTLLSFTFAAPGQTDLKVLWILQGELLPKSVRFKARVDVKEQEDLLNHNVDIVATPLVRIDLGDDSSPRVRPATSFSRRTGRDDLGVMDFVMEGLEPDTEYTWVATGNFTGEFRTPKPLMEPFNFTLGLASCADNGSNHEIFSAIQN